MGMATKSLFGRRARLLTAAAGQAPILPAGAMELATWEDTAPLTQLTMADLYGVDYAPLGRGEAMGVAAVAKGRHLICGKIASFPIVGMSGNETIPRPPAWLGQLEAGRPRFTTMQWICDGLVFHGRAWLLVAERYNSGADAGRPRLFELVPEHCAEVDTAGRLIRANGRDIEDQRDVVRIDGPNDGLLSTGRATLRDAIAIERASSRAADNPVPSVELHQTQGETLDSTEIDDLIARWADARRGKNGGVSYTNASIEAKMHGASAEQLLIAGRNVAALNIARHLGLSAWAVDAAVEGSGLTYNSVPARSRELIDYGLQPYMDAITARLSMDDILPAGQWCKFDTNQLTRGTMVERAAGYKAMIEAGVLSAEQCKDIEAGIPLEGK